tara:strand:- start:243 stop:536 length:294 start_codon:yes stop_codon:yes gene_type:complete
MYLNHLVTSGDTTFVLQDNEFSVHSDNEDVLDQWQEYFKSSPEWRDIHLKEVTPFESVFFGNHLDLVIEEDDRGEYGDLVYEAEQKPHSIELEVANG